MTKDASKEPVKVDRRSITTTARNRATWDAMTPEQRAAKLAKMHGHHGTGAQRAASVADLMQAMPWVFSNLDNKSVKKSEEPIPGAFAMLLHCRANDKSKAELFRVVMSFAEKAEMTTTERFQDDGRDVEKVLDGLIAEFEAKETEGAKENATDVF